MYPFAHLRDAYDHLWAAVSDRLDGAPRHLARDVSLDDAWSSADLLVGQTCGWPLVQRLAGTVDVIGAFDMNVPFAQGGRYRSVLVAAKPLGIEQWRADPAAVVAQNGPESLSGWISLLWAWGGEPAKVLTTGGHVLSMQAIAEGRAQVASIDAVSFQCVIDSDPMLAARMHVIGHGPLVPSLPLVMSTALAARRDEVRSAFAAAVADPAMAATCATLRIRGFVPFGLEDYEGLQALLPGR